MAELFQMGQVASERSRSGKAYLEFLRKSALSAGLYVLAAGAIDHQKPHAEDEIYYVLAGSGRFLASDRDTEVSAGDVLYVPAREPHRFHAVEEELHLLVFFAPAESSS